MHFAIPRFKPQTEKNLLQNTHTSYLEGQRISRPVEITLINCMSFSYHIKNTKRFKEIKTVTTRFVLRYRTYIFHIQNKQHRHISRVYQVFFLILARTYNAPHSRKQGKHMKSTRFFNWTISAVVEQDLFCHASIFLGRTMVFYFFWICHGFTCQDLLAKCLQ